MPRDSSGNYTLPIGAFSPGGLIKSSDMNSNFDDIALALTTSIPTNGAALITAPFLAFQGSVTNPGLAWQGDIHTGFYKAGTHQTAWAYNGVQGGVFNNDGAGGVLFNGAVSIAGSVTLGAPLPVAQGGTGVATIAAITAELNLFTNLLQGLVSPSGGGTLNFLRADNTWVNPEGVSGNQQVFTSTNTWTKPAVGTIAMVELWGGGQSGQSSTSGCPCNSPGAGGRGGSYARAFFLMSALPSTVAITIGNGGNSTTGTSGTANNGGDTTFGSFLTAKGGGAVGAWFDGGGGLGGGSYGSVYGLNPGQFAPYAGAGGGLGGAANAGGTSILGGAGGAGTTTNGVNGTAPGGGGGGADKSGTHSSGAGAKGQAQITVF